MFDADGNECEAHVGRVDIVTDTIALELDERVTGDPSALSAAVQSAT